MYYDLVRFLIWEAVDLKVDLESHSTHLLSSHCCRAKSVLSARNPPSSEGKPSQPENAPTGQIVNDRSAYQNKSESTNEELIAYLAEQQTQWLSKPNEELDGYIPAEVIDNERRRRPEAMTGRAMVVDEDCYCCKQMGDESEAGLAIYFCHFDGCNMEDEFAFSSCATLEEWKVEQRKYAEWSRKSEQENKEASAGFMDLDDCEVPF